VGRVLGAEMELVKWSNGQVNLEARTRFTESTFSGFGKEAVTYMNYIYATLIPKLRCEPGLANFPLWKDLQPKLGWGWNLGRGWNLGTLCAL
jgi:hypothetical protein